MVNVEIGHLTIVVGKLVLKHRPKEISLRTTGCARYNKMPIGRVNHNTRIIKFNIASATCQSVGLMNNETSDSIS